MTRYPTSMRTNIISTMCATIREQRAPLSFLSVTRQSRRIDREGGDDSVLILDSAPCLYASLYGNYIYYIRYDESEGSTLYKVKLTVPAASRSTPLPTLPARPTANIYNGTDSDHYIWRLNTTGRLKGHALRRELLYADCHRRYHRLFHGLRQNYAIARTDLVTGEKTLLSEDRVDWYNLYGDYIYLEKRFRTSVSRFMRTDGSGFTHTVRGKFQGHYNHFRICILS